MSKSQILELNLLHIILLSIKLLVFGKHSSPKKTKKITKFFNNFSNFEFDESKLKTNSQNWTSTSPYFECELGFEGGGQKKKRKQKKEVLKLQLLIYKNMVFPSPTKKLCY